MNTIITCNLVKCSSRKELVSTLSLLVELVIILSLILLSDHDLSPEKHQWQTLIPWSFWLNLYFVIPINTLQTDTNPRLGNIFKIKISRKIQ